MKEGKYMVCLYEFSYGISIINYISSESINNGIILINKYCIKSLILIIYLIGILMNLI